MFRRYDMRERPLVNTSWRAVLDQVHTPDNRDIDLSGVTDIVLYIYYSDFTNPTSCR